MGKKLKREFRNRHLAPDEISADNQVRAKIQVECPPSRAPTRPADSPLRELLQRSIRESEKSIDEIADETGVPPLLIVRFLSGERDIQITTAEKLASSVGLVLTAK